MHLGKKFLPLCKVSGLRFFRSAYPHLRGEGGEKGVFLRHQETYYLIRIHTSEGEEFLLHLEFAFHLTPDLPFRIHTYRAITEDQEEGARIHGDLFPAGHT